MRKLIGLTYVALIVGFGTIIWAAWGEIRPTASVKAARQIPAAAAEVAIDQSKVVWASGIKDWDGWKPDIERLKGARKKKPLAGYLYSEEVAWGSSQGLDNYALKDGRKLRLNLNGYKWEDIGKWEAGKKLVLGYDEIRGATLLDPVTGKWLIVLETFPIEDYLKSLEGYSTYDMMSVCYEGVRLVRIEIDRCVKDVLGRKYLPAKARENFIRLTKVRFDYCEMQGSFAGTAYHTCYEGGTIAGPLGMGYWLELHQRMLGDLLELAGMYEVFDRAPTGPSGK